MNTELDYLKRNSAGASTASAATGTLTKILANRRGSQNQAKLTLRTSAPVNYLQSFAALLNDAIIAEYIKERLEKPVSARDMKGSAFQNRLMEIRTLVAISSK